MPSFPTMATDGRRLAYNPTFVEKLSAEELEGVLAHEVMHCALAHHCRRGDRDAQLWNRAADYAVNPILIGNGITLPKDALIDPSFADLSAEEIYSRLKQGQDSRAAESPQQSSAQSATGGSDGNGPGQAPQSAPQETQSAQQQAQQQPELSGQPDQPVPARPGGFGEILDAVSEDDEPASQAELSRQMHEWAINAEQALCSAKACGREPGGVERPLGRARQS
jgi:predicted metal-dependent peptidase